MQAFDLQLTDEGCLCQQLHMHVRLGQNGVAALCNQLCRMVYTTGGPQRDAYFRILIERRRNARQDKI